MNRSRTALARLAPSLLDLFLLDGRLPADHGRL